MNDVHLTREGQRENLDAFNCLLLNSQDTIFQHALWMLGEPEAAEDLTQEIFLLAYRQLYSLQDGNFHCWLLRLASQLCLDELRRRGQHHSIRSLVGGANQNELDKTVQEGLNDFPPNLRLVLTLVDLQGMNYTQTSEILCIPPKTVKRRLTRARLQIRTKLISFLNG